MLIQKLNACDEFIAGDGTQLRELLHPDKQAVDLRYSLATPLCHRDKLLCCTPSPLLKFTTSSAALDKCTSTTKLNSWKPEMQFTFRQTPSSLFTTVAQSR